MKHIVYIAVLFSLVSCERELTLDDSNFEKEIVVNSMLSSDSILTVDLRYSSFFNDLTADYIDDAQVSIENLTTNRSFALINSGYGRYTNPNTAIKSHDYKLSVLCKSNRSLTATTCIPQDLLVDISIDTIYDTDYYINELSIDVEIANDPNSDNYYSFELLPYLKRITTQDSVSVDGIVPDFVSNSLPQLSDASTEDAFKTLNIFSDKGYDGKNITTSFNFGREDISFGDKGDPASSDESTGPDTVSDMGDQYIQAYAIRIMAVSPELFDYMKSYEVYNQQSSFNSSNTQPGKIEFNIENGIGVFGGTNIQIIPIN